MRKGRIAAVLALVLLGAMVLAGPALAKQRDGLKLRAVLTGAEEVPGPGPRS